MDAPGRSEASCSAPIPAPGSSSNLKNASKARATTSPPRKFKPHRRGPASASSPSKRAVTRATSHKFDIKLHSPIPSYPPISRKSAELPSTASIEAPTQPEPATNEGVTESSSSSSDGPSRASSRNIFSLPSLTSPRPGSSDVFGAHNPLVRGSGLGLSPERSPTTSRARPAVAVENEWNSTSTSSGKRSSVVYEEDQHDLSFDIASPQKRTAQSIFARSPLSHGHSTRLVDPVPVGVAGKRRRDAFDLVDLDALEGNDNNSSNRDPWSHLRSTSPVRKRVAFTQPGSVSPKMRHLRSPPASPEKHRASPTKPQSVPRQAPPAPHPVSLGPPQSLYPDLASRAFSARQQARPTLGRSHSLPADVGLAAPLPIRSSFGLSASSPPPSTLLRADFFEGAVPERPTSDDSSSQRSAPAPSPIHRAGPLKRSRSLTEFTFEALAEDHHQQQQQRRASLSSPLPLTNTLPMSNHPAVASDPAFASASPPRIRLDDFLSDSVDLTAPPTPPPSQPMVFGGALPSLQDSALSVRPTPEISLDQHMASLQHRSSSSSPFHSTPALLPTLMEEEDVVVAEASDAAAGDATMDPSTSFSSSSNSMEETSFSTEGMSENQIARLTRLQSMVSRLKPCRRLSTSIPPPAPYSAEPTSRLRSGNNLDSHARLEVVRPKPAPIRRGSLLEQASLTSASQVLQQQHSPPPAGSPASSPEELIAELPPALPLAGVVAHVDVRTTEGDDASSVFVDMLKSLGARVLSRHTTQVTHIVFKAGRPGTLERVKACRQKPHVVGIGWVVKSKETMTKAPEHDHKVDFGRPTFYQQKNRRKSFEPRAFTAGKKTMGLAQAAPRMPALGEKNSNVARGHHQQAGLEQARKANSLFKPKVGSPLAKRLATPDIQE